MAETKLFELPKLFKELEKAFEKRGDVIAMSTETLGRWRDKLGSLRGGKRKAAATAIVAIAHKFHRLAPDVAKPAVEQLLELASMLLGVDVTAKDELDSGGKAKRASKSVSGTAPGSPLGGGLAPPKAKR